VGAFDGDRLAGFTLVGLDDWKGAPAAYDIATGVVPGYRGRGVAREMFEFVVPQLRARGVARFVLEVIQENESAIKVYEAAGFQITRRFDCFQWRPRSLKSAHEPDRAVDIRPVTRERLVEFETHLDWPPSWENSFSSLRRIPDRVAAYGAFDGRLCTGILVYYPLIRWITTLVVKRERRRGGVASALLGHFASAPPDGVEIVRLANVDHDDRATLTLLNKMGFDLHARQFEMELTL
jgi:ribosomal protein S18 acetylase RimI-like enzyme